MSQWKEKDITIENIDEVLRFCLIHEKHKVMVEVHAHIIHLKSCIPFLTIPL